MRLPSLTMGWQTTLGVPACAVRRLSIKIKSLIEIVFLLPLLIWCQQHHCALELKQWIQDHTTLCVHLLLNKTVIFTPWSLKIKCKKRDNWWFTQSEKKSHCGNFWISLGLFFSFSCSLVVYYHDPALLF